MKMLSWNQSRFVIPAIALALPGAAAHAALSKLPSAAKAEQAIEADQITPEAADEEELVVVKRKPRPKVKKLYVEETELSAPAAEPVALNSNNNQAIAIAAAPAVPPPAAKPSTGQQLDEGIKTKMQDVQSQFEQALLKSLDRIKITVEDAPQGSAVPTQSSVVEDNLVSGSSAPGKSDYMSLADAPEVAAGDEEEEMSAGSSVAALPKEEKKDARKVRFAPVFGKSNISSSVYNVSSRYTAGFEIEMDIESNFSLLLGYSYSQYDITLGNANPFVNYYQPYGGFGGNTNSLGYNQNLFEGGMRVYLMPREAKFRIFGGAGVGYNLGYLNYAQSPYSSYQYNPYYTSGTTDYEVKSWLGLLSAGAAFNISENVSLGGLFKYALVFSSSENQPLNNYAFVNNVNYGRTNDQAIVGGSLAKENFYSILGTVKVAF